MRWRELTWLERIWVYNSVLAMVASAGAILALNAFYEAPRAELSLTYWIAFACQVCWGICFLIALVASVERVLGRGAYWRARRAILTRGMRSRRREGSHAVIAYPESGKIMMRVSRYAWRPRPWPLAMPVRLDSCGEFSRGIDADDQAALIEAFSDLSDRARKANQEERLRRSRGLREEQVATRINAQRP